LKGKASTKIERKRSGGRRGGGFSHLAGSPRNISLTWRERTLKENYLL